MKHTMRSAFKRWCILHNEESRIRIPNWFRYYIRENTQWKYIVIDEAEDYYCNKCEMVTSKEGNTKDITSLKFQMKNY